MSKSTTIKNLKFTKRKIKFNQKLIKFNLVRASAIIFLFAFIYIFRQLSESGTYASTPNSIWEVRSVDTMKTSRDMARAKLGDISYNKEIERQIKLIKGLGANYVAIGTPYDEEFLPYLKRWVKIARDNDLKIWYRGSFSGYEGWFEYSKSVTPDQLLTKTQDFIVTNEDLFEDGDIFDPCPECENGGYWPQPSKDKEYEAFVVKKQKILGDSFKKIDKKVIYNFNSIIGGRAKETLSQNTLNELNNVVAIDHYAPKEKSYEEYIEYFKSLNSDVVISEFGAPIPDMHGAMTEKTQAEFVNRVLGKLYYEKENVRGINYWVLNIGTTSLYNADYSERQVAKVLKNYYSPVVINGEIRNTAGDRLNNIEIKTSDGTNSVKTDDRGFYQIVIPAGEINLKVGSDTFYSENFKIMLESGQEHVEDFTLEPKQKDFIYNLRLRIKKFL